MSVAKDEGLGVSSASFLKAQEGALSSSSWGLLCTQEVGYQHGRTVFDIWVRSGVLEKMLQDHQGTRKDCGVRSRMEGLAGWESRALAASSASTLSVCSLSPRAAFCLLPGAHLPQCLLHRPR